MAIQLYAAVSPRTVTRVKNIPEDVQFGRWIIYVPSE